MDIATYLMDSEGRLSRTSWLFRSGLALIACTAFGMLAHTLFGNTGAAIFAAIFLWRATSISIRRLHDANRSGKLMYVVFIPVLGPLWLFWLLIQKGTAGPNSYGLNADAHHDYLRVNIFNRAQHSAAEMSVNDVTQINPIPVLGVLAPHSIQSLQETLQNSSIPLSVGGGHFSMGGHTASLDTLHLDLRLLNKVIQFDPKSKIIRVEAGMRWCDIQRLIDPHHLSVKIMQTYANFTVGGSLSVNVHGRYIGLGPVVLSVRNIALLLQDGELVHASPSQNTELFYAAIGGYGAIGIIVEVELDLVENTRVERSRTTLPVANYLGWFKQNVRENDASVFHNADIYPPHYTRVSAVTWSKTEKQVTTKHRLQPLRQAYPLEIYFLWAVSETPFGKFRRQFIIDPLLYLSNKVHWRNFEAGYDAAELEPLGRIKRTYVLQEYFVPLERLMEFVPKMADILNRYDVNTINISIRHAVSDPGTLMRWANGETFALVLYYKQRTKHEAKQMVGIWTRALIDAVISCGGTYYLPYQLHGTADQFESAYPHAKSLFSLKKKLDPNYRFRSALWDKYYMQKTPSANPSLFHQVYDHPRQADRFYMFLKHIFNLYPEDKLHSLISDITSTAERDEVIYQAIQKRLPDITPALSLIRYALPSLFVQKTEMGKQAATLIGEEPLNDYVEIGSTGRYVRALKRHLNLKGNVVLVHDKAPTNTPVDIVERGQLPKIGSFTPLNDYAPIALQDNSADLVSCFIGLHHMAPDKRLPFLNSIANIVRPGGYFILRDHDVKDAQMDAFVSLAHCVFNAGLGEPWAVNAAELRHFESIDTWISMVESVGFQKVGSNLRQDGDLSDNMLLAFKRLDKTK